MPFITEEIWHAIYEGNPPLKSIALAGYPQANEQQFDLAAETEMAILQDLIVNVRNVRAELKVEPKVKVPIEVFAHEPGNSRDDRAESWRSRALGKCGEDYVRGKFSRQQAGARSTARFDVHVIYERKIDVAAECERLKKELEKIEKEFGNNQTATGQRAVPGESSGRKWWRACAGRAQELRRTAGEDKEVS